MVELHVLPPEVVSRIAAGEVVERPASVVKELIENSLDAGADKIDVDSRGGGAELLCVADNGSGIPYEHVEMAFLRHATSKIASLEDLVHVHSLGFRGEALPSIASVADVEVSTSAGDTELGSYIYIHGGAVMHREGRPRAQGTTIAVRRLFRHFPARLKFLKSEATENGHIAQVVSQYALAFPAVAFSLLLEDRIAVRSPGNGVLRDVIAQLYGTELARAMVRIESICDSISITGLAAPASLSRAGRGHQSMFINHRWIRSPLLQRAVDDAYRGLIQEGRNAVTVLNLQMPPDRLDVNVHPSKAQVKFADEQAVFRFVRDALKTTLMNTSVASDARHLSYPSTGTQDTWSVTEPVHHTPSPQLAATPTPGSESLPPLRILGQLLSTYIVAEGPDGMYLVDQHAAHERVVYDSLVARKAGSATEVQGLLEPIAVELSPTEESLLVDAFEDLSTMGFMIDNFGNRTYLLRSIPAVLRDFDATTILRDVLHELSQPSRQDIRGQLAITISCHAAVRAGRHLTTDEMKQLILQLERCVQPRTCPHGRPTVIRYDKGQLDRLFGRRT